MTDIDPVTTAGTRPEPGEPSQRARWPLFGVAAGLRPPQVRAAIGAAVGWSNDAAFTMDRDTSGPAMYARVSVPAAVAAAAFFASVLVLFYFWSLRNTDLFRVAPTYPWWRDARDLRTQIRRVVVPLPWARWRGGYRILGTADFAEKVQAVVSARYAGWAWAATADEIGALEEARRAAMAGLVPATPEAVRNAVVALAILEGKWRPLRLPYSLSRVQWGTWMMFTVVSATYLWLVYGRLPTLDGSVVALIAISTITAGVSFFADGAVGQSTSYSNGIVQDVMTGANDAQQAHRYQAVVVNALLLVVGVVFVAQHLTFPSFDSTWLELLGLSGAAQTLLKPVLEKP